MKARWQIRRVSYITEPHLTKGGGKEKKKNNPEYGAMTRQSEYKLFLLCSLLNTLGELGTDMSKGHN